ncbi:MAG TPA: hypothetical protein VLM42_06095, partial [Bryobacteraceae bacterium]|nr:hypothetical protein [Bryobacteraceae bacterium]
MNTSTESHADPPPAPKRLTFQLAYRVEPHKRLDERLNAFDIQPVLVGIAGISEALGQWLAVVLQATLPQSLGGLDDVHILAFDGIAGFV